MKALLLAAGRGERMRPLTDTCPKALLELAGDSLIGHHISALARAGIRDLVVNSHHLARTLEQALGDGSRRGVQITWSHEPEVLETGGAVVAAADALGPTPFVLVSTDIFFDLDYRNLPTSLPRGTLAHLLLVPNPAHHPEGDFCLGADGRVSLPDGNTSTWNYAGIAVLDPKLVAGRPRSHFPLRDVLLPAVAAGQVSGQIHCGRWHNLGTPAQLAEVRAALPSTLAP